MDGDIIMNNLIFIFYLIKLWMRIEKSGKIKPTKMKTTHFSFIAMKSWSKKLSSSSLWAATELKCIASFYRILDRLIKVRQL